MGVRQIIEGNFDGNYRFFQINTTKEISNPVYSECNIISSEIKKMKSSTRNKLLQTASAIGLSVICLGIVDLLLTLLGLPNIPEKYYPVFVGAGFMLYSLPSVVNRQKQVKNANYQSHGDVVLRIHQKPLWRLLKLRNKKQEYLYEVLLDGVTICGCCEDGIDFDINLEAGEHRLSFESELSTSVPDAFTFTAESKHSYLFKLDLSRVVVRGNPTDAPFSLQIRGIMDLTSEDDRTSAPLLMRFLGHIFDIVGCIILFSFFSFLGVLMDVFNDSESFTNLIADEGQILLPILSILSVFLYYYWCETSFNGKTLGKVIFRMRAIENDGFYMRPRVVFFRTLCRFIPCDQLSYLLGGTWHDNLSKTIVVKEHRSKKNNRHRVT